MPNSSLSQRITCCSALSAFLILTSLSGAVVADDFDSLAAGTSLNGRTFVSEGNAYTWMAPNRFVGVSGGGSVAVDAISGGSKAIFTIPSVTSGTLYEVSADVTVASSNAHWITIGFSNNSTTTGYSFATEGHSNGTIFLRGVGEAFVQAAASGSYLGATSGFDASLPQTLRIVLDTRESAWTLTAFVGDVQLDLNGTADGNLFTYQSNPIINYVGFSASSEAFGTVDNFKYTSIPEPGTYAAIFGVASLTIILLRRRSRQ